MIIVIEKIDNDNYICYNRMNANNLNSNQRVLTDEELEKYEMKGFENFVCPVNTKVNSDGSIFFNKESIINQMAEIVREKRNELLQETDIYMLVDYPIDNETKEKIKTYRQKLRDITKLENFPFISCEVPWPKKDW